MDNLNFFSKKWVKLLSRAEVRILMLGLGGAGKTAGLQRLILGGSGPSVKIIPSMGFSVETWEHRGLHLAAWDVGGPDDKRVLWSPYYQKINILAFVVDSTDRERIEEAAEELKKMLEEDALKNITLLIMANKQDIPGALSPGEVAEKLGVSQIKGRLCFVEGTSATTGQGLSEGLALAVEALRKVR